MELLSLNETIDTQKVFLFNDKKVRVIGDVTNPMFIASDVCKILGLSNISHALTNIPDKWKGNIHTITQGGKQDMLVINEAGLYKLIMKSKKQVVEKFQEWVCEEVLPSIRKKGEYVVEEYKKKLEESEKKLEEKEKKLEETQTKLNTEENLVTRLRRSVSNHSKKYHFYHSFKEMPSVYILSDPNRINQSELKIGYTDNINNRLASDRCMIPNLRLEFLMYCTFAVDFEKIVKIRYREQFTNPNHEWLVEPLEDLISFFRKTNKLLMLNGIEEDECYKYNMEEKVEKEEDKKEEENQEEDEDDKEDREENISDDGDEKFVLGLKQEILSVRIKKLLTKWLLKSDYIEKNKKATTNQRYCNGWCQSYINISEFRAIRSGGLLSICKKCENMEEIARVKIEQGKCTVEQIKANPLLLMCTEKERICRQCLKVKDAEKDFEASNRKCRECKRTHNRERDHNIDFRKTLTELTEFTKDLQHSPVELKTQIKSLTKSELILMISDLKLGRNKDDVKEDMVNKIYRYFLTIRNS